MKVKYLTLATIFLGLGFAVIGMQTPDTATAQSEEAPQQDESTDSSQQADTATYSYTVQPGDSYTKLARKAIQTYGIENSVNLSGAEIVFAETNLTREAGSPAVSVGANVSIPKATVKKWVDAAAQLSDTQEAAWNRYVATVNFDTSHVGESPTS